MFVWMSEESVTVPRSFTRTGVPSGVAFTITSLIGSTVLN